MTIGSLLESGFRCRSFTTILQLCFPFPAPLPTFPSLGQTSSMQKSLFWHLVHQETLTSTLQCQPPAALPGLLQNLLLQLEWSLSLEILQWLCALANQPCLTWALPLFQLPVCLPHRSPCGSHWLFIVANMPSYPSPTQGPLLCCYFLCSPFPCLACSSA
jgi:hypothetical protein